MIYFYTERPVPVIEYPASINEPFIFHSAAVFGKAEGHVLFVYHQAGNCGYRTECGGDDSGYGGSDGV